VVTASVWTNPTSNIAGNPRHECDGLLPELRHMISGDGMEAGIFGNEFYVMREMPGRDKISCQPRWKFQRLSLTNGVRLLSICDKRAAAPAGKFPVHSFLFSHPIACPSSALGSKKLMSQTTLFETWFAKPNSEGSPLFQWGFLVILTALLGCNIWFSINAPSPQRLITARGMVISMGLLLNHLAFHFPWSRPWLIFIRSFTYIFGIMGCIFVFSGFLNF
jgi:hypothetical protein